VQQGLRRSTSSGISCFTARLPQLGLTLIFLGGILKMADLEIDARGLNCPMPILRAKKVLNGMTSGQTLRIVATDPGSVKDFSAFAKQTGATLLESSEANKEYTFVLKKA
jgi:tRNA 2-thiouridine synthesizing protein A